MFNLFKKSSGPAGPYADEATNTIYNLLFCDDVALFRKNNQAAQAWPFDVLLADAGNAADLQRVIDDNTLETRARILAYNRLLALGHPPARKELLGVIVEVGLDQGLDTLAAYTDGTARYINYTGSLVVWEAPNEESNRLIGDLFGRSLQIVQQIGPWDQPRKAHPAKGSLRLSFLVSDGLYFGEGPMQVLFNDPMAGATLASATALMQYLTSKR
jgi:hypothetical protein